MSTHDEQDFIVDEKTGRVLPLAHNVRVAVKKLGGMLRYNERTRWAELHGIDGQGPPLDDRAVRHLFVALEEQFGFSMGMGRLRLALEEGADRNRYNAPGGERE